MYAYFLYVDYPSFFLWPVWCLFHPPESVCCSCLMTQHCHWHQCWKCVSDRSDKYRDNISEPWKRASLWGLLSFTLFLIRHITPLAKLLHVQVLIWNQHLDHTCELCLSICAKIHNFLSVPKMTMFCAKNDEVPSMPKKITLFHLGWNRCSSIRVDIFFLPKMMRLHQCQRVHSVLKMVTLVPSILSFHPSTKHYVSGTASKAILFGNVTGFHKQQIQAAGPNDSSDRSYDACVPMFLRFTTQKFSSCLQSIPPHCFTNKNGGNRHNWGLILFCHRLLCRVETLQGEMKLVKKQQRSLVCSADGCRNLAHRFKSMLWFKSYTYVLF